MYEIAEQVEVLNVFSASSHFTRIADELLGEFGTVSIRVFDYEEILNQMDIVFVFENIEYKSYRGKGVICYPEKGIVEDGMFTKSSISPGDIKVDFLPLKDIVEYDIMPFCNLPPAIIGILNEKLLFTSINSFSDAKSIFTKNLFDVKIKLK
ncbi:hypothetical protein [Caldicellulosiruptor naganoensis]|uniref:Uncharacterized protein n=1 Tax=Caldicellulosiruptor naganoensis TaxID=29324 RepID=A0ABY7BEE1_9FIRM|nr:hypothetical protein [Caldicellulosiruptor naganoensis]WAM31193.1 hypothetical protein OTJ99_002023 [Caldicellulosiruptor naganoensis]